MQKSPHAKIIFTFALVSTLGLGGLALNPSNVIATTEPIVAQSVATEVSQLDTIVAAIRTQIPEVTIYQDMQNSFSDIGGTDGGIEIMPDGTIATGAGQSQVYVDLTDQMTSAGITTGTIQANTFGENIALAKSNPAYNTNNDFKTAVDQAEAKYNSGLTTLRTNLALVDPALTDLDTKSEAELTAIYNSLPAVRGQTYRAIIANLESVDAIKRAQNDASIDQAGLAQTIAFVQNELISEARHLNPDFKLGTPTPDQTVDVGTDASATKTAPGAPKAGDVSDSDSSAQGVKIATAAVALAATFTGVIALARAYLFSPLKRRK